MSNRINPASGAADNPHTAGLLSNRERADMRPTLGFMLLLILINLGGGAAEALSFGQNKLPTRDLVWRIFETPHFEIFYYPEESALAEEVCRLAEDAYAHTTHLFRFQPESKTPLFIYRNQVDFQQTNILPSVIGVGTGGFTEAFKNRIALPAPPSVTDLRQVVIHELSHAIQFNILYGEGLRSFRIYKGYLIPLWIMEGSAEYAADNWDPIADMLIRDAVIHDRLIPLTLLEGFSHLDDVYLAYKESQLAIRYLMETYGEESVALIFNKLRNQVSISQILRETIGLGLTEFNRDFVYWVRQKYWVQAQGKTTAAQVSERVSPDVPGRLTRAHGPAWSPDGRYLAFWSDQDTYFRIFLKPRNPGQASFALTSKKFETVSLQGHPLAWSPDSNRLSFVAQEEGKTFLYTLAIDSGVLDRRALPLDNFYSPRWSPDGRQLVLVGVRSGISDLFLYTWDNQALQPLTQDRWADNAPVWSPDGRMIGYVTERDAQWQLAQITPLEKSTPHVLTYEAWDHFTPCYSPDGRFIYFSSDEDGILNLRCGNLENGLVFSLLNLRTGSLQPAVSPDGKRLAYSTLDNGCWTIFQLSLPAAELMTQTHETLQLNQIGQGDKPPEDNLSLTAQPDDPQTKVILSDQAYGFRFSPDLIFLLVGYDSSQGLLGGGYLTASDFLGNHQVALSSEFVPGYQSRTVFNYINSTFPIRLLLSGIYQRNDYRVIDLETGTLLDEFDDEQVGGAIGLARPFSLYDRLELEFSATALSRTHAEGQIENRRLASLRLSMIHDSTQWFDYEPIGGLRHHLAWIQADKFLGGTQTYSLLHLDSQAYWPLGFLNPRLVLSTRLMAAAALGPNHPLFLFGGAGLLPETTTIRGYRLGELIGSQVAVLNLEFRFPLAHDLNYSLWPLDFLLMKNLNMVLYDDVGLVTNNFLEASADKLLNSVGFGLRLHTFLLGKELLTIRFDLAQRTHGRTETITTWGIGQTF